VRSYEKNFPEVLIFQGILFNICVISIYVHLLDLQIFLHSDARGWIMR
jgi:hypothetical protein